MVNQAPEHQDRREAVEGARALAELRAQITQARTELQRVQADLVEARERLGRSEAAQLLEANEQLMLGILRAKADAETATRALDEVSRLAEFDALTQLPNRVLLFDRFAQAIAVARRRNLRLAVLFLDLNNFKQINDTLGHSSGDQVLQLAASRLESAVRSADTVSRHGGDEFVVLLTEVSEAADAALIAEKVLAALSAPSRVGEHVLRLTASIGISVYPDDGDNADALIDAADAAMYIAKRQGFGSFAFFGERVAHARGTAPAALASLRSPLAHRGMAVSEHERRHAQLKDANERLLLAALGAQALQAAAEQARQRQTELLAVVAHELRNPLNPIRTAAALLGRARAEELPRLQAIIERQVLRVSRLASDLLDVSRVSVGKLRIETQLLDLASVVDEAVDTCRPAMDLRLQRLRVQWPARSLQLHGDPVRLAQVLCNLLDNASKYTPDGGEIGLSVLATDEQVAITVSDNGIGMTPQAASDIFEPFVQEPHAVDFNGVGLGLGLTVVRELVQAHGGTVVGSSAGPGLGSRFVVTLPLAGTAMHRPAGAG